MAKTLTKEQISLVKDWRAAQAETERLQTVMNEAFKIRDASERAYYTANTRWFDLGKEIVKMMNEEDLSEIRMKDKVLRLDDEGDFLQIHEKTDERAADISAEV